MAAVTLTLKRGDTAPTFRAQCLDGTTPVPLTSAQGVRLLMRGQSTNLAVALTVDDQTARPGWVRRNWAPTDLAVAGTYRAEVEVTWSDGTVQTFPRDGYAYLSVIEDLG